MTTPEFTSRPHNKAPDQRLIDGRYRLQERIGHGRLGEIYLATDEIDGNADLAQAVAVQVAPDIVAHNHRVFNKLKVGFEWLRAAAHPNIVNYVSFGRENERVFLVMEFLEGLPVDNLLDITGALPLDEVLPVLRDVGEALQLLHENDFVHGNLTAGNVFITEGTGVRLLDVVPMDAANAIFGGDAITHRSTAADDVFALASLAYQMLAGSPAAVEPARVAGLSDRQWGTLRRALARAWGEEPVTVAGFMREFDQEGLQPLPEPAANQPISYEPVLTEAVPTEPITAGFEAVTDAVPHSLDVESWPDEEPGDIGPGRMRAVLLGMLLAVLGGWYYYGQPAERAIDAVAYIDQNLNLGLVEPEQAFVPVDTNSVATVDARETTEEDNSAPGTEEPASEPADAGPPAPETAVAEAVTERSDLGPPEPAIAETVEEPTELVSTEGVVSVSERSGVAKVWLRRNGESKLPLVWWTSDDTAHADSDYVAVPEQLVNLAPDEMLHVPLVNDDMPEQRESFFVDFGVRHTQGQIERIASVRIDIDDDDTQ